MDKNKLGILGACFTIVGFILFLYPILKFIVSIYEVILPGHFYFYLLGIIPMIIGNYMVTELQK